MSQLYPFRSGPMSKHCVSTEVTVFTNSDVFQITLDAPFPVPVGGVTIHMLPSVLPIWRDRFDHHPFLLKLCIRCLQPHPPAPRLGNRPVRLEQCLLGFMIGRVLGSPY
jgi:hypothetical protein